jgi:hypothetical protein
VRAQYRQAEPLTDIARHVQRRVADAHVHAPGRDQDGDADIPRARTVAQDEQPRDRDENHPRALRPAENARRVALHEAQHDYRGEDWPRGEREHGEAEHDFRQRTRGGRKRVAHAASPMSSASAAGPSALSPWPLALSN